VLGYRLRQNHVGVVAWTAGTAAVGDTLGRLEHAIGEVAVGTGCGGQPLFVPYDESCAWVWLPLGGQHSPPVGMGSAKGADAEAKVQFASGGPARGVSGFRRTHQEAASAQAVALAAGASGPLVTSFSDVAPLALMSGSIELLHAWVTETLGALAGDDAKPRPAARNAQCFPAEKRQLQGHRRAADASQEHRPVPGAQG
jgi:hypothetical protein